MLKHGDGTGRDVMNAACKMETYNGGLQCCQHHYFLTDLEQDAQIPNKTDTYFLKWPVKNARWRTELADRGGDGSPRQRPLVTAPCRAV